MFDLAKKVSPFFSTLYCILVYLISITLPSPRTAAVTHEMAIAPFLGTSALLTSVIYFSFVLFFVLNRSKILNLLGKFLSPILFLVILSIICIGIFSNSEPVLLPTTFQTPIVNGLLEGYQTFDAIGAVVVGAVLIVSLKINAKQEFANHKNLIIRSGLIAGIGLFIVYSGMIYNGALVGGNFDSSIGRTELLSAISLKTLGTIGEKILSILVGLACFTTAIGIVTGTADYFKSLCNGSQLAYSTTAIIGCILGVVMGQFDVHYIIGVAVPALMFIYPITIVLILLNVLPHPFNSNLVFRVVVFVTLLFSFPDFLVTIGLEEPFATIRESLPLGEYSLAWLLPAIVSFIISSLISVSKKRDALV